VRILFTFIVLLHATTALFPPLVWAETEPQSYLDVYVRETCPHCRDAKAFLPGLMQAYPSIRVRYFQVGKDSAATEKLVNLFKASDQWPPSVPAFVHNGKMLVGFKNAEETGPLLTGLLMDKAEQAPDKQVNRIAHEWFGTLEVDTLGLPLFTLVIGLIDGFNPCAMWVLLFLLSILVHLKSRLRMALIAGSFVLVSGLVYYAFMAAWLNLFLAVGLSRTVQYLLALIALAIGLINIKSFFNPQQEISLSIPAAAKPGLYARMRTIVQADNIFLSILAVTMLAIIVNFIELLCTAGLPALYTAILTQMELAAAHYYAYIALYILGYMADDALMVTIAVIALSSQKLSLDTGRHLKLLTGAVMLLLGVIMILKPEWLY